MKESEISQALERLEKLKEEMNGVWPIMRGSVVMIGKKGKQPYFSVNDGGKTRIIYLGKKREGMARRCSDNYARIREIIDEITMINMRLLRWNKLE